jgi:uncharacterized protein YegP (UPF0339 family)
MEFPRYEVYMDANNQFRFNLKGVNWLKIIGSSQTYGREEDCLTAIRTCQENSVLDRYYDRRTILTNFYFVLLSKNGRELARSENFSSSLAREKSISECKISGKTGNVCPVAHMMIK